MVKQRAQWAVRKFWGGAAALLILMAVVIQLGRFVSPMVSENRESISSYFSDQLGVEITIGQLDAVWDGLRPELMMSDFRLHDDAGVEIVHVKTAVAQIDLLKSLWDFQVRMWKVELDEVHVTLSQVDKAWSLAGMSAGEGGSSTDPLDVFLMGRLIRLNNIYVNFEFASGRRHQAVLTSMLLQNDDSFHRLSAQMNSSERVDALKLVYEGVGDPRVLDEFEGHGYLELTEFPLENTVAFASEALAEKPGIKDGDLSAKLWASTRPHEPLSVSGSFEFERSDKPVDDFINTFSAQFSAQAVSADDWQLSLREAVGGWTDRETPPLELMLSAADDQWAVQIPQLDIGYWLSEVEAFPQAPESVKTILLDLGAAGHLHNLSVNIPYEAPQDFSLSANLVDVSVNAWKGAPQIASLTGFVSATALSGVVEIDSPDAFFMHFPTVYRQGFHFQRAQGQVGWSVNPDNNQVTVNSGQLTMEGELGLVNGYFYLDAPLQRNSRPAELVLQIGLQNAAALSHRALVPFVVPDSLTQWLGESIVDGKVPTGSFVMQSYFGHNASSSRSIQVGLNLEGAHLQYDPKWPEIQGFDGYVEVDSPQVGGWIDRGRFLQTELQPSYVHIENHPSGKGSLLSIQAAVEGQASSGLKVLTDTPLRETLGDTLASWALEGQLFASVDLDIPLASGLSGHRQQVDVTLKNATLEMNDLDLEFQKVNGALSFNEREGLSARNIGADLWQQPFLLDIDSSVSKDLGLSTDVSFEGPLDFSRLEAWSRRPEVAFINGVSPVTGVVRVGGELPLVSGEPAALLLKVNSELAGSRVDLPAPFGKTADDTRQMSANISVAKNGVAYQLDYGDQVSVSLVQAKEQKLSGRIALNNHEAKDAEALGIWLSGSVGRVDGEQWWPVIQRYQTLVEQWELVSDNPEKQTIEESQVTQASAVKFDLDLEQFFWGDFQLSNIHLGGGQQADGWKITVDDDVIAGEVILKDGQPAALTAQYIRWPALESIEANLSAETGASTEIEASAETLLPPEISPPLDSLVAREGALQQSDLVSDWLTNLLPSDVMPMDVVIYELFLGQADFGRWTFQVRPEEDRIRLSQISGDIRGITVSALAGDSNGAELLWSQKDGVHRSEFRGLLAGRNLERISEAWSLPRMLDSKSAVMKLNLSWPGTPSSFMLADASGDLSLKVKDGRFYRSTGQATSALLRLVGLFNFDSWVRRLQLDFSDVYKGGTPYEEIKGAIRLDNGIMYLVDPIEVKNTSSRLQMGGKINLEDETLDTSLVATLPVGGNVTLITALAAGLPAAAGVYAVSKIFKKQVERVASVSYQVTGSWSDPEVTFDRLFDNRAAKDAAKDSREDVAKPTQVPSPSPPP